MAHSLPETFAPLLLRWYAAGHRDLPWRQDRELYHIWLSEIMLQQTRVETVRGYYARFLAELPDIAALAACEERRLTKLWEGLGYYSRVRNLQKAAQVIVSQHGASSPRTMRRSGRCPAWETIRRARSPRSALTGPRPRSTGTCCVCSHA